MESRGLINGRGRALAGRGAKRRPPPRTDPEAVDSTAVYLAHMTDELAKLARCAGLELLSYLLDMARLEAVTCARAGMIELPEPNER